MIRDDEGTDLNNKLPIVFVSKLNIAYHNKQSL